MKKILLMATFVLAAGAFGACNDDNPQEVVTTPYVLTLNLPATLDDASFTDVQILFTDVNTGRETKMAFTNVSETRAAGGGQFQVNVAQGTYNIGIDAGIQFSVQGMMTARHVSSTRENVTVAASASGSTPSISIELSYINSEGGFVIEEVFFAGTKKPDGNQYLLDQYFRITNNSDELLYADGIAILESNFLTITKRNYTPDIMSSDLSVGAVYVIPGNGTDVPVEPGESLIIANNGMDHRAVNANSIDLTTADFEWYDGKGTGDSDNPDVKNLDKWYAASATTWGLHSRGYNSYAIAKMEVGMDEYIADYAYTANFILEANGTQYPMSIKGYRVPNSWIIDAVNVSTVSGFEWIVTDPSLDMGWTHCGTMNSDPARFGTSVRRMVDRTVDGRNYLKDTNNSTNDFEAFATPSLFE